MYNLNTIYGVKHDPISCQAVDTGLYSAFREIGNIQGVYVGHDHQNDYWGDYNGIKLHFGRKTGYGGYGPPWYMQRGARVIEWSLDENQKVEMNSWIREERG